jgi:O-antigen/teichoic acid export membrane protein
MTALVLLVTPFFIPMIFGKDFRASISPAIVLVPASGLLGINYCLEESLRGLGMPYLVLRAELLGLGSTALLLTFLLNYLGILGAALASLGGYATVMVSLFGFVNRVTGVSPGALIILDLRDATKQMGVIAARIMGGRVL